MATTKGTCMDCNRSNMTIVARGMCGTCYKKNVPPAMRRKTSKYTRKVSLEGFSDKWPKAELITIYHTSDGREHGSEVEALKWQLDIERARYIRVKGGAQ